MFLLIFLMKWSIFSNFSLRVDFFFFFNKYQVFDLETQFMCQIVSTGVQEVFEIIEKPETVIVISSLSFKHGKVRLGENIFAKFLIEKIDY